MTVVLSGKRRVMRRDSRNVVRGEQTRRRILDAARTRILAAGFEALRLDDIAADVGVSKAAVIKSAGGKSAILLAIGDEDRHTRLEVIRAALKLRTGLRRRVTDVVARLLDLDAPRQNVVVAYVGYMWFWSGADHERSHAMIEETRELLGRLLAAASPEPLSPARLRTLSLRLLAAYAVGVRELHYRHATRDAAVRLVVDLTLV
jgi:AcrR family transcriptional regulator